MSRENYFYLHINKKHKSKLDELICEVNEEREKIGKIKFSQANFIGALIQKPNKKELINL